MKKTKRKLLIPEGFLASGVHCGLKTEGQADLGIIHCPEGAVAAVMTTTNRFPAAPVEVCRERTDGRTIYGIVVNSKNANAVTGAAGLRNAKEMARQAETATGSPRGSFLVASTGIIGAQLPMARVRRGIGRAASVLSPQGWTDLADSIRTTDTFIKLASASIAMPGGGRAAILAAAKGSGMLQPDMATMLAFVVTDYPIAPTKMNKILRGAVNESLHGLTIDGQTSTNDTIALLSSCHAGRGRGTARTNAAFGKALTSVCQDLVSQLAADGEGATKSVEIEVIGAASAKEARRLGLEVANSPLVKTALYGESPNWGRIAQALGKAGVAFEPNKVTIEIQGMAVMKRGLPCEVSRAALRRAMKSKLIAIEIRMGRGNAKAKVWTCDLTHDYVRINVEYN